MTATPVVPLGRRPRSCVSRSRVDHAAAATRRTAASAKAILRIRARQAAVGKAPTSCVSTPDTRPGDTQGNLRGTTVPVLARDLRQLDGSANSRRKVGRRVDGWSNRRPRKPPGSTRKRVIAPRGGLELLGDELEGTALLLDSVVPYRLLQKDERLLERTEHGLGRSASAVEAAVRAHAEATPRPRARVRRRPAPEQRREGRLRGVRARGGTTWREVRRRRPARVRTSAGCSEGPRPRPGKKRGRRATAPGASPRRERSA